MPCTHMKELYQLIGQYDMKLASSDPIRILCPHCDREETCPDLLMDEANMDEANADEASPSAGSAGKPKPPGPDVTS